MSSIKVIRVEGVCVFRKSPLENSYFISYPDLSIIQKRLTGWLDGWVGLVGGHGLDRAPWRAQSHHQTVTKTKRSVTKRWWACCQGRQAIQPWLKNQQPADRLYGGWGAAAAAAAVAESSMLPTSSPANSKYKIKSKFWNKYSTSVQKDVIKTKAFTRLNDNTFQLFIFQNKNIQTLQNTNVNNKPNLTVPCPGSLNKTILSIQSRLHAEDPEVNTHIKQRKGSKEN